MKVTKAQGLNTSHLDGLMGRQPAWCAGFEVATGKIPRLPARLHSAGHLAVGPHRAVQTGAFLQSKTLKQESLQCFWLLAKEGIGPFDCRL